MDFSALLGGGYRVPPWLLPPDPQAMGIGYAVPDFSLAPPAPSAPDPAKVAPDASKGADAAASASPRSGFLDRLAMAQAYLSGDPSQMAALRARQDALEIQRQELALRQQAAQRTEQDQANQIWGMKASGLFSNPQIAALGPHAAEAMQARVAPYVLSPGQERHVAGDIGQPEQVTQAPIAQEQTAQWLSREDPTGSLRQIYASHEAMPPISFQPGGGVAGAVQQPGGGYGTGYIVQPYQSANPQGAPSGAGGGNSTRNNPGGLRVPGSTQFRSFPTPAAGVAAGQAQLGRYIGRGINTVRSIIETWAPRRSRGGDNSDESVNNYIAHVASRLGVNPDQPLPPSVIPQFFAAQTEFETGHRGSAPVASASQAGAPPRAAALRAQAARAIAEGRDPAQVRARLRQMGVSDAGL